MIYHEIAMIDTPATIHIHETTTDELATVLRRPICAVCRQLRLEAGPVLQALAPVAAGYLHISMTTLNLEQLSVFSDYVQSQLVRCGLSSSVPKRTFLDSRLDHRAHSSLQETLAQLQDSISSSQPTKSPFRYVEILNVDRYETTFDFNLFTMGMSKRDMQRAITKFMGKGIDRLTNIRDKIIETLEAQQPISRPVSESAS